MTRRAAILPALLSLALPALAGSRPPEPEAGRHELRLSLDPQGSELSGSDRYTAPFAGKQRFFLRDGIELESLRCGDQDLLPRLRPDRKAKAPGRWEVRVPRSCAGDEGELVLDFAFRGRLDEPPSSEVSLVDGAGKAGRDDLLSEQGVALGSGTGFYPDFGELAYFDLEVDLPLGWSVASQGRVAEASETAGKGRAVFAYEAERPSDGIALWAGPYHLRERKHGDTLLRTFFFEDDAATAEQVLEAAAHSLDRLEERLGPHPHSKFDLVETARPGSRGVPGCALLGSREIAAAPRGLRPGQLAHALARSWLGDGVLVDAGGGNWSEGLASTVAEAIAAEEAGAEAATASRRKVSQRYATDVPADRDLPPVDLRSATDAATAAIGQGKVSMVFHQLRREIGDELFWTALRDWVQATLGRRADWSDIQMAFEQAAGRELGGFFSQWIERPGLPALALAELVETEGGVSGVIVQQEPPYELRPEIRVLLQDGRELVERLAISGTVSPFQLDLPGPVASVELDPEWHLPRHVETRHLPHSLARTLAAKDQGHGLLIAYPIAPFEATQALEMRAKLYKELAEAAAETSGGEALPALAVAEAEWNASSLLLIGGRDENPLVSRVLDALFEAGFDPTGEGFRAGTRRWFEDGDSLLVSLPHPNRAGASVSVWIPNGDSAVASGRSFLDHRWDTWVAMRDGVARERGSDWPEPNPWKVDLAPEAATMNVAARLRATVERLERPELEGRDAATTAARRSASEIAAAMESAGLEAWDPRGFQQVFFWFLRDLPRQAKLYRLMPDRKSRSYDCTPAAYSLPVPPSLMEAGGNVELADEAVVEPILIPVPEGLVHAGTVDRPAFRGLDLRGAAAVLIDELPLPSRDETERRSEFETRRATRYMELLSEVRRQEGETLLIIRPDEQPPFFPALASFPSLDVEKDPSLAEAARAGGRRGVQRAVSAMHAATPDPSAPVRLLFAGSELLEAMRAEHSLRPGQRWWQGLYIDFRMHIETQRVFDRNLIGMTRGMRKLSEGVVLISAHHDGLGLDPDGRVRPSAIDNAAGTAVMLELARRLAELPPPLTVAFVSFGAKEWGLLGSRSLTEAWPAHWPVRALVNLDALGREGASLRLIDEGGGLGDRIAAPVSRRGLSVASHAEGDSGDETWDHQPWLAKGVPALSVSQSEPGSAGGRIEDIDFDELATLVDALEEAVRELASGADS